MTEATNIEMTIVIEDPELEDETLHEVAQNLLEQISESVEFAYLVPIDQAPKGSKGFGGFMSGSLTASVKPANLKKLGLFLKDRLGDKPLKLELESADGRKFKGEASSREEMEYLFQKAQEWEKMAKIALLIGSGQFESQDLQPLPKTSADLEAMKKALIDPELGGFVESDVIVLPNPQKQQIEDAVYDLFDKGKRKTEDLLLLYFSGHGITDESGIFYFSTKQTRKDNGRLRPTTALSSTQVHQWMNKCPSKRMAIILDCCYSGAFAKGMSAKGTANAQIKEQLGGEGRAILTAASAIEYAWAKDELPLSVYTHYFLEGVNTGKADQDGNDWLSLEELHNYAKRKIIAANIDMTPEFYPVREGAKIRLFKAKIINPQEKYKKAIQRYVKLGNIPKSSRRRLETLRQKLKITPEEAQRIEKAVFEPIQRKQENLKEYESFCQDLLTEFGSFDNDFVIEELKLYQQELELTDEEIEPIQQKIITTHPQPEETESQQQQEEQIIEEEKQPPSDEVELKSEKGVDYRKLRDLLKAGKWREADEETANVMLQAANRVKQGWLDVKDIDNFPCDDLRTIDQLWVKYSKGKFGFSVQKKIYVDELGGTRYYNEEIWYEFCDRVGWRKGGGYVSYSDLTFELLDTTPVGHLPSCSVLAVSLGRGPISFCYSLLSRKDL